MAKICFCSIDIEPAQVLRRKIWAGKPDFQGVESLDSILSLFKQFNIPLTLFVSGEVLEKYPEKVKEWAQHFEIACHSFTHYFWSELSPEQREQELNKFLQVYRGRTSGGALRGFRAPSHLIDTDGLKIVESRGFLYDSSVLPHYPFFKKYRGFQGKAPLLPYYPSQEDCRQRGERGREMKILEIPVTGQLLGIPLVGAWITKLPLFVYRVLFLLHKPSFLTLNLHSFDILKPKFLKKLEKILVLLQRKDYQFLSGEQIYAKFFSENRT